MSAPDPEDQAHRIKEALFAGHKIEAIKLYRELMKVGLKESKDAVEKLEAELRTSSAGSFKKPQSADCLFVIAVAALGGAAVWRLLVCSIMSSFIG